MDVKGISIPDSDSLYGKHHAKEEARKVGHSLNEEARNADVIHEN